MENIFTFSSVCLHVKFGQTYEIIFVDHRGVGESKDTHPHIYRAQGPNRGRGYVRRQTRSVIEAHSCR